MTDDKTMHAPQRMAALVDPRREPQVRDALDALGLVAIVLVADADGDVAIGKLARDDALRALVNSLRAFSKAEWVEAVHRVWVWDDEAADRVIDRWRETLADRKLGGSGRRWFRESVVEAKAALDKATVGRVAMLDDAAAMEEARACATAMRRRVGAGARSA